MEKKNRPAVTVSSKPTFTESPKSESMERPEQCVKSLKSYQKSHQKDVIDIAASLLLTLNRLHKLF